MRGRTHWKLIEERRKLIEENRILEAKMDMMRRMLCRKIRNWRNENWLRRSSFCVLNTSCFNSIWEPTIDRTILVQICTIISGTGTYAISSSIRRKVFWLRHSNTRRIIAMSVGFYRGVVHKLKSPGSV